MSTRIAEWTFDTLVTDEFVADTANNTYTVGNIVQGPVTFQEWQQLTTQETPLYPSRPVLRFSANPQPATLGAAITADCYWEFTLNSSFRTSCDIASFSFDAARGGGATPRGVVVRWSDDSYASDLLGGDIPTQRPTLTTFSADLGTVSLPVTFRFYFYSPGSGSTIEVDNLTLDTRTPIGPLWRTTNGGIFRSSNGNIVRPTI